MFTNSFQNKYDKGLLAPSSGSTTLSFEYWNWYLTAFPRQWVHHTVCHSPETIVIISISMEDNKMWQWKDSNIADFPGIWEYCSQSKLESPNYNQNVLKTNRTSKRYKIDVMCYCYSGHACCFDIIVSSDMDSISKWNIIQKNQIWVENWTWAWRPAEWTLPESWKRVVSQFITEADPNTGAQDMHPYWCMPAPIPLYLFWCNKC